MTQTKPHTKSPPTFAGMAYAHACQAGADAAHELITALRKDRSLAGCGAIADILDACTAASGGADHGFKVGFLAALEEAIAGGAP